MNQALLKAAEAQSLQQLTEAICQGHTVALTGLHDTQAAFVACRLASDMKKRVLLVLSLIHI